MKSLHISLMIFGFGLIISVVPLTQAAVEAARGNAPQVLDLFQHWPTISHLRAFEKQLEDRSMLAQATRPWMQYLFFVSLRDPGEKALWGRSHWLFYKPGVQFLVEPWPSPTDSDSGPEDVLAAVQSFHGQLAARGIRLLVVPVPGKASVYPERLTRFGTPAEPPNRHTRDFLEALRQRGIESLDLTMIFAKQRTSASDAAEPLYLARDTHWTPTGMSLAAHAVADRLVELGWTDRGNVAYTLQPRPIARSGDILRMMQMPRTSDAFPPEPVLCQQVALTDTATLYEDNPESDVLVLGDSFLRIYSMDEPGAAGFVPHLAHALSKPVTSIVNDGGASTLVRQELARKPSLLKNKRVVVWEFVERDLRFGLEGWEDVRLPPVTQ